MQRDMRSPDALLCALCLGLGWLLSTSAWAAPPPGAPVVVYGVQLESLDDRERLLVFARGELEPELLEKEPGVLVVRFPNALLDPSAATRIEPEVGDAITLVSSFQLAAAQPPEVRVVVRGVPGLEPRVSRRGAMVAVDFHRPGIGDSAGITLRFDDTELAEIVRAISAATGESFLFDDALRGRVTIFAADRVTPAEAVEILHSALLLRGFAAVPTPGGPWKIVAIDAGTSGAPWSPGEPDADHAAPITTLVRLHAADARSIADMARPWIGTGAQLLPFEPTNSLVLAGSERRLVTLLSLVRALDESADESLWIRRLRHRDAGEIAEALRGIFEPREGLRAAPFQVWPERQSNALVVRSSALLADEIREWIERLDQAPETYGVVDVIKLRYADPERIAQELRELAAGRPVSGADLSGRPASGDALAGRPLSIAVDAPTASLLVASDPLTRALVREVVGELDRLPPSIDVEVVVLEIATSDSLRLGVDAFIPLTEPKNANDLILNVLSNPSGGGLVQPGPDQGQAFAGRYTRAPLVIPIVDPQGNPTELILPRESVVVTANGRKIASRVLARPHLLVTSGEAQELFVGDNVPVPTASTQTAGTGLDAFETRQNVERRDVGLRVRVTPSVGQMGGVRLELDVDQSRVVPSQAGDVQEVGPSFAERSVQATLQLDSGEFAVVGMANGDALDEQVSGPPFLKDIPVLSQLFTATRKQVVHSHLVIAVQAWIDRSGADRMADTVRRRLGFARAQARVEAVPADPARPFALRIDTAGSESEARKVAERFEATGRPAAVSGWEWEGLRRYDVYLTGFDSLAAAGAEAAGLVEDGYHPEVVALPGADLSRAFASGTPPPAAPAAGATDD